MGKNFSNLLYWVWLCILVSWHSPLRAECPVTSTGLCTPGVEETIVIDEVETIEYEADGYTVTTETTTTTTTVTTTNPDSGDILDGDAGYVSSSKYEGDMDLDWGGQGPASMPSGNSCYNLGTDKCAQITGSGNSTSTMGVSGMGTTFIQTVDISDLDIENGGRTNYSIKVDKRDSQDRIYMHITGKNGNTSVFSGTDILSESGVASGYQTYENGFDFAGTITKLIIEVGGRDINLAIGPLFDDVQINVLYNVVSTIVTEHILSVEMWVAYGGSTETEVIDIVENIFEHNDVIVDGPGDDMYFEPEFDEPDMDMSYETVEIEMEMDFDFEMEFEMEMPDLEMPEMEMEMTNLEMEMEMEMELPEPEMEMAEIELPEPEMEEVEMETTVESEPEPEPEMEMETEEVQDEPIEEDMEEPQENVTEEAENEESVSEAEADEDQPEDMEETEDKGEAEEKPVKKQEQKEKAAKKIVKKMGDKGRYDSTNQLKTLIVMQVLGDTKTFFESQKELNDREGFFTEFMLPDTQITNNNLAQYYLFAGSDGLINEMIESQWQQK
tara:strand:+ start:755 stop:2419 length:1665 start_codon:yes stop_codon:yes gene_type:complete